MDWCVYLASPDANDGGPYVTRQKKLSETWATFRRLSDSFRWTRVPEDIRSGFYIALCWPSCSVSVKNGFHAKFSVDVALPKFLRDRLGKYVEQFEKIKNIFANFEKSHISKISNFKKIIKCSTKFPNRHQKTVVVLRRCKFRCRIHFLGPQKVRNPGASKKVGKLLRTQKVFYGEWRRRGPPAPHTSPHTMRGKIILGFFAWSGVKRAPGLPSRERRVLKCRTESLFHNDIVIQTLTGSLGPVFFSENPEVDFFLARFARPKSPVANPHFWRF